MGRRHHSDLARACARDRTEVASGKAESLAPPLDAATVVAYKGDIMANRLDQHFPTFPAAGVTVAWTWKRHLGQSPLAIGARGPGEGS